MSNDALNAAWSSPSNIAIIKYWGKHGDQLPDNPSLSITLTQARTMTKVVARKIEKGQEPSLQISFEDKDNPAFAQRIQSYLNRISEFLPFLREYDLQVESKNTFPHSAGIASSASAMSALALCLQEIQSKLNNEVLDMQKVSILSRLGSGSACRSIYGPVALWGGSNQMPGSADEYAIPLHDIHPVFETLCDTILIVDDEKKAVSSSEGHALMKHHPFGSARIQQANAHLEALLPAMKNGDMTTFGEIAELEALALHALMMTSSPSYVLMKAGTLSIIEHVRAFRAETKTPVYFTLDAGPNVHLLYPEESKLKVKEFIYSTLMSFCVNGMMIEDVAGSGPVKEDGERSERG
jgi:diphosphomevalonate decarboxylase